MPAQKRLFWAIDLPEEIIRRAGRFQQQLVPLAPRAGWVKPQNMHITLVFWGEQETGLIAPAVAAVREALQGARPFTLKIGRPGYFGRRSSPAVLWLGLDGELTALHAVQKALEEALTGFNHRPENRFHPHLTLARLKKTQPAAALLSKVEELAGSVEKWPDFTIDRVQLVESVLRPGGPVYTVLEKIMLT
ncbi:MAG: RNA 2',3'-cyclic phosphodiesterase [Desulfurispora sp.]|uniref:RNA 2',3'-cyclic phosphodiesterase n=1 Tax=Desulfurispora sp. TaxID=3014275 RepID=UPI00404AE0DB